MQAGCVPPPKVCQAAFSDSFPSWTLALAPGLASLDGRTVIAPILASPKATHLLLSPPPPSFCTGCLFAAGTQDDTHTSLLHLSHFLESIATHSEMIARLKQYATFVKCLARCLAYMKCPINVGDGYIWGWVSSWLDGVSLKVIP